MSFVLFHLSDFHIKESSTLKQPQSVVACLREIKAAVTDVAVVISGDIAFSGRETDYKKAKTFLETLVEKIREETECIPKLVIVPGNHDCTFPSDSSLRDLVVAKICEQRGTCESLEMLKQCLGVQNNFFEWVRAHSAVPELPIEERFFWKHEQFLQDGHKVVFQCLNTAWLSTLHEQPSKLFFPVDKVSEIPSADIIVSILHHPYSWFDAGNGRYLRRVIEESSDIIITGHEHEAEIYTKSVHGGPIVEYIEGDVYHVSSDETRSGFNMLVIDLAKGCYQIRPYTWKHSRFSLLEDSSSEWIPFLRNAKRKGRPYEINDKMRGFLQDPGAQLTHRAKTIELEDIYITPNLRRFIRLSSDEGFQREVVESEHTINRIFKDQYVYFSGDGQCGKTALAKRLFHHALERGLIPVFIKGELLNHADPERIQKIIISQYSDQYSHPDSGTYVQQSKENKVIIVDDFFDSRLNRESKASVCEWLINNHGYVFVFGGDLTHIEEIIADFETGKLVAGATGLINYEIIEFGYLLREKLIEKWLSLGMEHLITKEDLAHQVNQVERFVDTVLGKNLVPAYPIFVLVILQQLEAGQELTTLTGAYGYFYDVLITGALRKTSVSVDDIDMKYTYLAELAWHLFSSDKRDLDVEELEKFNSSHWEKYRLTGSKKQLVQELIQSRILGDHGAVYIFKYKYLYYYFVARYMRDNMSEPDVTETLRRIINNLHREDFANIIIFLSYLSRDRNLIDSILCTARQIFPEIPPCNFEDHIAFLNRLMETVPQIFLPEGDPAERRKQALRNLDIEREKHREPKPDHDIETTDDESQRKEIVKMMTFNRAFKSMQIMGQILRNFSGSLKGAQKQELVAECFSVGLRSLNALFGLLEKHTDSIITHFSELVGKNIEEMPQEKRIETAKGLLFFLIELLCLGTIKRISFAVGSERLLPTYDDVQKIYNNVATEFVQAAIRMDHSFQFPEKRVFELKKNVEKNIFAETLLRMLVADHFYMFLRSYKVRQRVCEKLGIKPKKKMLTGSAQTKRKD